MDTIILIMSGILILVGMAFGIFGYLIYFRKKYNLINNFKTDKSIGKYSDDYALQIGFIELWSGIFLICTGILGLILEKKIFSITSLIICITFVIIALVINNIKFRYK